MENLEITEDKIEKALRFIRNSKYELMDQRVRPQDLRILMPNFFNGVMAKYYRNISNFNDIHNINLFEGMDVYPHYKNEVVVYDGNDARFKQTKFRILILEEIL